MFATDFFLDSKRIQDEKIEVLKCQKQKAPKDLAVDVEVVNVFNNNDHETFFNNHYLLKKALVDYETEVFTVRGLLDNLRISCIILNKSFFSYLMMNLGFFRNYEVNSDKLIALYPKRIVELKDELLELQADIDERNKFRSSTKEAIRKAIKSKEDEISRYFIDTEKITLFKEIFPDLSSFSISKDYVKNEIWDDVMWIYLMHFEKYSNENEANEVHMALRFICERDRTSLNSALALNLFDLSEIKSFYENLIYNGYSKKFFSLNLTFFDLKRNEASILNELELGRFNKDLMEKSRLCFVVNPETISIEPHGYSFKYVEPLAKCPGIAIEFGHCVAILPETFSSLLEDEEQISNAANKVLENWCPSSIFTKIC
ncbi:MAG: hypothetical protein NT007_08115 [Candidatus Kapabacteria bacterium]|nr:hypothetical protein [Candidatus Kapabacteria bacterium]